MSRISALTHDAPGLYGPPDSCEGVSADDVIAEWMDDDTRLREACDCVASLAVYSDALVSDFHSALIGHNDDRAIRAERLLAAIESKVRHEMRREAESEAERRNAPDDDFNELEAAA